jgi:hypothetical protein
MISDCCVYYVVIVLVVLPATGIRMMIVVFIEC